MVPRFLTILTGRNLPKIQQARGPEPSTINKKTVADFMRVVKQTGILQRGPGATARASRTGSARTLTTARPSFRIGSDAGQTKFRFSATIMRSRCNRRAPRQRWGRKPAR